MPTSSSSKQLPKSPKERGLFEVSQSRVSTRRQCYQKYHYKYNLQLVPIRIARPLKFGTIVHAMHEEVAERRDPYERLEQYAKADGKLFREEQEMYGDIIQDIRYIFRAYQDYWRHKPINYLRLDGRHSEIKAELEIKPGIVFTMRLDGMAKYDQLKWLVEHKNHKNFPDQTHRWRNLQSCMYIRIIDMLDWFKLDGTLWNYIRTKPPTRPQLKKDGTLSLRDIDTLPEVIIDTINANNLNLEDYRGFIQEKQANLNTWFERVKTPVKKKVVDAVYSDFVRSAIKMYNEEQDRQTIAPKHRDDDVERTIGRHCDWCEFEPLCRAYLTGSDIEFVKEREFTIGEPQETIVETD